MADVHPFGQLLEIYICNVNILLCNRIDNKICYSNGKEDFVVADQDVE